MTRWGRRWKSPAARRPTRLSGLRRSASRAAFVGKVKDDRLGRAFSHDIRRRREFRHQAGRRRSVDRALLRAGDAGRRAHHEHLSRRRAGSASGRYRCRRHRRERHHLSRRLFVGSEERQGRVPQGGEDRARGRPQSGADIVGRLLRRSLARRVLAADAHAHRRSDFCQRGRAAQPLSNARISMPRSRPCAPISTSRW